MRRVGRGGFTVFSPTIRPNVFSPVGVDDLLERHGESALWTRLQPCPCPSEERLPDCRLCLGGYVRSYQETTLIEAELCRADGHILFPRYAPVRRVVNAVRLSEGPLPLTVKAIRETEIEVAETLKDWHAVNLTYEVSLAEWRELEANATGERRVRFTVDGAITAVDRLFVGDRELEPMGFTFDSVLASERLFGPVRARVRVYPYIKIAYRTFELEADRKTERTRLIAEGGEVELTVANSYFLGEGDILTLMTAEVRAAQYIPFTAGDTDLVSYAPITRILNCVARTPTTTGERLTEYQEGEDFEILSNERIRWLGDKPRTGYSLLYGYHPSFRIGGAVEAAGGMDRRLPRKYRGRAASSTNFRGAGGTPINR